MKAAVSIAILSVTAGLGIAQVAGVASPWDRVVRLRPGQTIRVEFADGRKLKGRVESAGPDGLTLRDRQNTVEVQRNDVARITRKSRAWGAFWGGVVCFGIAAPIGAYAGPYIADWGNPKAGVRLRHAAGWGLFFGGVGAGIGALAGDEKTLYRARAPGQ